MSLISERRFLERAKKGVLIPGLAGRKRRPGVGSGRVGRGGAARDLSRPPGGPENSQFRFQKLFQKPIQEGGFND